MPKKVSETQKKEMIDSFINGTTIDQLSYTFKCTKTTITRHLKKNISESDYKNLIKKIDQKNDLVLGTKENLTFQSNDPESKLLKKKVENSHFVEESFVEIAPLTLEIDNSIQKDFSSVPISEINFPQIVYMVVDKNVELEIKLLKDYPEWEFLSEDELNRKTIEIYFDLKIAKRFCNKDQKVIKVPNTEVFKITAPILISRGISRIVSDNRLISLQNF